MSCGLPARVLFLSFVAAGYIHLEVTAQEVLNKQTGAREIADIVIQTCSDQSIELLAIAPEKDVISSTISNSGQVVGYLTEQGIHIVHFEGDQDKVVNVDVTAPADLRLIDEGRVVAVWMPSKLILVDMASEEILQTFAPREGENRFLNWATSSSGKQVILLTNNAVRYILNLSATSGFLEHEKEPRELTTSSLAISDDGLRVLTLLEPHKLAISNQDLTPPDHIGVFQGDEFMPGLTKLAVSNTHIGVVGKDMLNVLPIPQASAGSQSPVLSSGDFVCLFAQMGMKPNGERLLAAVRSQLNDDLFMVSMSVKDGTVARLWKLPESDPHALRWSLSGDRVCYSTPDKITVIEASPLARGVSELTLEPISARLIENKDFAAMDDVGIYLEGKQLVPVRPFDRWYGHLSTRLIGQFQNQDAPPEILIQWLAERPDSELARLMMAHWHRVKGWAIRGDGFVVTKTDEQMTQFREHFVKAYQALGNISERRVPRLTIETALEISKGLGPDYFDRAFLIDKLCEEFPDYSLAHVRVVEMLMPRWGGSAAAVNEYINRVSDLQPADQADRMYATLTLSLMPFFENDQVFNTFDLDVERVVHGAQSIDLSNGQVLRGYRDLMVVMFKQDRTKDAYELWKHHTKCTPFVYQSYKYKGTGAAMRRRFMSLDGVGTKEINAGVFAAMKSLERRTVPAKDQNE